MRYPSSNENDCRSKVAWRVRLLLAGIAFWFLGTAAPFTSAQDTQQTVEQELSRPMIRGGMVFKKYCVLCHGDRGDGVARAAKLFPGLALALRERPDSYNEKIIRLGGAAVGQSEFMPPWQDELSDDDIVGTLKFMAVLGDPVRRGEVVFKTNCVLCHGVNADGKGRAAQLYDPPPANLARSNKTPEYKEKIIRVGGAGMGRSPVMPLWEPRLAAGEIADLLEYLQSILVTTSSSSLAAHPR